jgi:hypothetical protein
MIALLAGANITNSTEMKAMTELGLELALTVFMIDSHSGVEAKLPLLDTIALVKIISDFLSLEVPDSQQQGRTTIMDATNYALRAQIPLLAFLAEWVEGMARGLSLSDIVRHKAA